MRNLTIFAGLNPTCCIVCRLYSMGLLLVKHPLDTHIHPPPVAGHQARWTSRGSAGWGAAWFGYVPRIHSIMMLVMMMATIAATTL